MKLREVAKLREIIAIMFWDERDLSKKKKKSFGMKEVFYIFYFGCD